MALSRNQRRAIAKAKAEAQAERDAKRIKAALNANNREIVQRNKAEGIERNYYPQSQFAGFATVNGLAKKPSAKRQLTVMFQARNVKKEYGAIPKG